MFTGNAATSLATEPSSYSGYLQQLQYSSSSNPHISSESPIDQWNHVSGSPEAQASRAREHHPRPYSLSSNHPTGISQDTFSSTTIPAMRVDSDGVARAGFHPFIIGHG